MLPTVAGSCGCMNSGLAVLLVNRGLPSAVLPFAGALTPVGAPRPVSGVAPASGAAGASISQSQPSFMQLRKFPCFVRFSTMNGAPHFGHGSLIGSCGVVKSQSG